MGNGSNIDNAQFRAFVSYSHADAAIAKKLHRKMEAYKLPKLLREMQSGGKEDGRLGQLFRDREDLPAALDLSESVKAALAQSQVLIVLCSPNAKNSPWVAKEIELFRELHADRPILAALVSGEPEESFPPALTKEGEPLAADLRKEGDGWRLGLLKLVAGVAEVPLDALVQRDAQRQFRSVMAVTLAVGTALLAMIGMTMYAIQQRNEAQHQQAQAEGLIEYMLTDLRRTLEDVGRLDAMKGVNESALGYYKDQANSTELTPNSQKQYAKILRQMGENDEQRGDDNAALAKYRAAYEVTKALLAGDPTNANLKLQHLQSENALGYYYGHQGDHSKAMEIYEKSVDVIETQLGSVKPDPEWLRQSSYAYGNICSANLMNEQARAAFENCKKALVQAKDFLDLNPDDNRAKLDLAIRYAWMADTLIALDKVEEGLEMHGRHLSLVEELVEDQPFGVHWYEQKMRSYVGYVQLLKRLNRAPEIKSYTAKARIMGKNLQKHEPNNDEWVMWLKFLNKQ